MPFAFDSSAKIWIFVSYETNLLPYPCRQTDEYKFSSIAKKLKIHAPTLILSLWKFAFHYTHKQDKSP